MRAGHFFSFAGLDIANRRLAPLAADAGVKAISFEPSRAVVADGGLGIFSPYHLQARPHATKVKSRDCRASVHMEKSNYFIDHAKCEDVSALGSVGRVRSVAR